MASGPTAHPPTVMASSDDPPPTPMARSSFGSPVKSSSLYAMPDSPEPAWLTEAAAEAETSTPHTEPRKPADLEASGSASSLTSIDLTAASSSMASPMVSRMPSEIAKFSPGVSRMTSDAEEPAWLSHAAASVELDSGATLNLAFKRAIDASRAAFDEFRGLSASEISDGLLALSASCFSATRIKLRAGLREVKESTSAALAAVAAPAAQPDTPYWRHVALSVRDQRWVGALLVPYAGLLAMLAVLNAVLAIMVTFAVHTPRAAREFRTYAEGAARHYGLGQYSSIGQHTAGRLEQLVVNISDGSGRRPPPLGAGEAPPLEARAAEENV